MEKTLVMYTNSGIFCCINLLDVVLAVWPPNLMTKNFCNGASKMKRLNGNATHPYIHGRQVREREGLGIMHAGGLSNLEGSGPTTGL